MAEVLAEMNNAPRLVRVGIDDTYCAIVGDQNHLRDHYGLTAEKIADRIAKELA